MIDSGIKTEEYREIKPYWEKRLLDYKSLSDYVEKNYKAMLVYEFVVHGSIQPHIDDVSAPFSTWIQESGVPLGVSEERSIHDL